MNNTKKTKFENTFKGLDNKKLAIYNRAMMAMNAYKYGESDLLKYLDKFTTREQIEISDMMVALSKDKNDSIKKGIIRSM